MEQVEAKRLALRASAIGRDDALALSWAGSALAYVCAEFDSGEALVERAISVNPNLADCWQNRAIVSSLVGQHEAAIGHLARALRFSPRDPEGYRTQGLMAQAYMLIGQYDEALRWTARSLAHQPNYLLANRVAAGASALSGRLKEAASYVSRIRALAPAMRLSNQADYLSFRRPQDIALSIEGLRLAGLPDAEPRQLVEPRRLGLGDHVDGPVDAARERRDDLERREDRVDAVGARGEIGVAAGDRLLDAAGARRGRRRPARSARARARRRARREPARPARRREPAAPPRRESSRFIPAAPAASAAAAVRGGSP